MWIFSTLVGLGLAFVLYALVQFHGEGKGRRPRRRQGTDAKPDITVEGRVLHINSKQAAGNDSGKSGTKGWSHGNGEIRFRSISRTGDVFIRRIRQGREPKFGFTGKPGGSSKAR